MKPEDDSFYDDLSRLNNELVNLQRELAKKNAELKRLNELKNQFLGMAAHDLRKPVGLILTYSEFLLDERANLDGEHADFLDTIHSSSEFMQSIIDDFLDVAMIESGRFELNLDSVDLARTLQQAIDLVKITAGKKHVSIISEHGELPAIFADGSKLEQAFANLLGNAVEHSPPGAAVVVACRHDDRSVVVSIRDQGPGISPEEQETIFAPFGRGRSKKTGGERSIGLGLVIARKVVEAHGGRIWIESQIGHGAVFIFSVPVTAQAGYGT